MGEDLRVHIRPADRQESVPVQRCSVIEIAPRRFRKLSASTGARSAAARSGALRMRAPRATTALRAPTIARHIGARQSRGAPAAAEVAVLVESERRWWNLSRSRRNLSLSLRTISPSPSRGACDGVPLSACQWTAMISARGEESYSSDRVSIL